MKSAFFPILYGVILLLSCHAHGQSEKNQAATFTNEERLHLESLQDSIAALFDNVELSWDDILIQLESLSNATSKKFGQNSLSNAFIIHKKGVVCYNKGSEGDASEFKKAIKFYDQAIAMRLRFVNAYPQESTPDIINGYSNIGSCYRKGHDPFKAIDYILKAIRMAETYPFQDSIRDIILQSKILVSRSYHEIADYDNSLQYYSSVLEDLENIKDPALKESLTIWKLRALIEMGGIQAGRLDQPEQAITHLTLAEKIMLSNQIPKGETLLANTYHNLGIAYSALGNLATSLACYKKSITLNTKTANTSALADNYLNLGSLYNKMHKPDSAEYYLQKAGGLYSKSDKAILSFVYDNLGDAAFEKGMLEKSIGFDNLAMQYLVPGFEAATLHANPALEHTTIADKEGLLISLHSKGRTLSALYKSSKKIEYLKSAYNTLILADKVLGKMRSEFLEDASKITLVKNAKPVYAQAIFACWELYNLTDDKQYLVQAFEFSEKSRAIILLDAARKAKVNFKIASPLVEKEHKLVLKIHYFEKQTLLETSQDESSEYNVRDSLLVYRRQHAALIDQIKKQFPNYYHLAFEQPTLNPDQVKALLKPDQAMIEYFLGSDAAFAFVISADSTAFVKIDLTFPLESWVEEMLKHIHLQDDGFISPAFRLYEKLILPLGSLKPKLIIVPDDVLGSIPFDVLVKKMPATQRVYFPTYKDYMIFDHQISYAFSATTQQEASIEKPLARRSFLGVAPTLDKSFSINNTYFDKLEWNTTEVENAHTICGGKSLSGDDATKKTFLEEAPAYGIIHLATHAKANTEIGDLSYIVFGPTSLDLLYAKDLYALNLNADMVVLSACQTGSGSLSKGEGIISLARGFTYAGASSVITSLWNVKEEANKDVMLNFYKGIEAGLPKDEALRNAKLNFLKTLTRDNQQFAHPFYWAPLLSIGDQKPYTIPFAFPWTYIAIAISLPLLWLIARKIMKGRYRKDRVNDMQTSNKF